MPDDGDSCSPEGDALLTVSRDQFLKMVHAAALPEDAACVLRIRDTMNKIVRRRPTVQYDRGRGRGRRGGGGRYGSDRGGGRHDRSSAPWAREQAPGKRPLKGDPADVGRALAGACNKLSAGNFDRIFARVRDIVSQREDLLDVVLDNAGHAGSFSALYVRMITKLLAVVPSVAAAIERAAVRFKAAGGVVMPFQETSVESGAAYDDFCVHTKNRRVRLCTLGVLLRLGVAGVAADALAAFEVHAVADGDALVHMDLVVDGVAEVTAVRPDLRPRVLEIVRSALTARGGAAAGDPRTRFKMLDVAESCKTARPQTRPRRAG